MAEYVLLSILADGRNNDFISQHHNIVHSSFKIYQLEKIIKEPWRIIKYLNKRYAIENYGRDSVFINQHLNNVLNLSKNLSIWENMRNHWKPLKNWKRGRNTVLSWQVKTRLRDPASWLPLASGTSSRNLVFTF